MELSANRLRAALIAAGIGATLLLYAWLPAPASAFIYWAHPNEADEAAGSIARAENDGSGVDLDFIPGVAEPCGVDVNATHIYWSNGELGTIGRANLDGTNVDPDFIVIPPGIGAPCGLDVSGDRLFWANRAGGPGDSGSIGRANLDGTGIAATFFSGSSFTRTPIDVARGGDLLFWANSDLNNSANEFEDASIGRGGVDGVPPPDGNFLSIGDAGFVPFFVAADSTHYYTALSYRGLLPYGVLRGRHDGTETEGVTEANALGGLDVHDGKLYIANPIEGTISRMNPDGQQAEFAVVRGAGEMLGIAVDSGVTPPDNSFGFGKLKRNKKKGTAKLEIVLPGPGTVELDGKGLKSKSVEAAGTSATLPIAAAGKGKRKLKRKGKAKLTAEITFTPVGGTPATQERKLKLVLR